MTLKCEVRGNFEAKYTKCACFRIEGHKTPEEAIIVTDEEESGSSKTGIGVQLSDSRLFIPLIIYIHFLDTEKYILFRVYRRSKLLLQSPTFIPLGNTSDTSKLPSTSLTITITNGNF